MLGVSEVACARRWNASGGDRRAVRWVASGGDLRAVRWVASDGDLRAVRWVAGGDCVCACSARALGVKPPSPRPRLRGAALAQPTARSQGAARPAAGATLPVGLALRASSSGWDSPFGHRRPHERRLDRSAGIPLIYGRWRLRIRVGLGFPRSEPDWNSDASRSRPRAVTPTTHTSPQQVYCTRPWTPHLRGGRSKHSIGPLLPRILPAPTTSTGGEP